MLCQYSHTKSESLAQIRATSAEVLYYIFSRDCFYWRTLYISTL